MTTPPLTPAAKQIPTHTRILSDAQIADYHASGYLTLRNIFDEALLQRLTHATDRLWDQGRAL